MPQAIDLQTIPSPSQVHLSTTTLNSSLGSSLPSDEPSDNDMGTYESPDTPPPDHGRAPWLVCAGCSLIQAPVWGFSITFGVLQEYYTNLDELRGDKSGIASIGTAATGMLYLSAPITFALLTRYPFLRPWCGILGLLISVVGFLASSFTNTVGTLLATQGVIAAIGSGLLYSPTTLYLDEWFVEKKGVAYGIVLASKSAAGVGLPFAMEWLLGLWGWRVAIRVWAVVFLLITAPLLYFLKPRLPPSTPRTLSFSFMTLPSFWILQTGNIMQSLGYFLPTAYLASYAGTIGLNPQISTMMIALLNAANVPGSLIIGMLNDRLDVSSTILVSTIGSTLAVFIFWGLASHAALLAIFSIFYGFFAGGFSATWSGAMNQMKRERPAVDTGFAYGLLAGVRGVGNVISGPLSSVLITNDMVVNERFGYQTKYEWLIIFTGITALLSGWSWGWKQATRLGA